MPTPAAMRQLADLRDQLGRVERLRLKLIDDQPVSRGDLLLAIDRSRDFLMAEISTTKSRLAKARAA